MDGKMGKGTHETIFEEPDKNDRAVLTPKLGEYLAHRQLNLQRWNGGQDLACGCLYTWCIWIREMRAETQCPPGPFINHQNAPLPYEGNG